MPALSIAQLESDQLTLLPDNLSEDIMASHHRAFNSKILQSFVNWVDNTTSVPGVPQAGKVGKLNASGTYDDLVTATISGDGVSGRVPFYIGTRVLGTHSAFSWNSGTQELSVGAVIGSQAPTLASHLTRKDYVDALVAGVKTRIVVRAASTGNVNITSPASATFDGVTISNGQNVLLRAQTAGAENGVWVFAGVGNPMTRHTQMDEWDSEVVGAYVIVSEGSTYADTRWLCTNDIGGTLGTTAITFSQLVGQTYTAGSGLILAGNEFSVDPNLVLSSVEADEVIAHDSATFDFISGNRIPYGSTFNTNANFHFTSLVLHTPNIKIGNQLEISQATISMKSVGGIRGRQRFYETDTNGLNYVELIAPDSLSQTFELILPGDPPSAGQVLAVASWSDPVITTEWIDAGAGGGSGTVNSGLTGKLAFYPSDGTTVDDTSGLHYDSATARLGINVSSGWTGKLNIAPDSTTEHGIVINGIASMSSTAYYLRILDSSSNDILRIQSTGEISWKGNSSNRYALRAHPSFGMFEMQYNGSGVYYWSNNGLWTVPSNTAGIAGYASTVGSSRIIFYGGQSIDPSSGWIMRIATQTTGPTYLHGLDWAGRLEYLTKAATVTAEQNYLKMDWNTNALTANATYSTQTFANWLSPSLVVNSTFTITDVIAHYFRRASVSGAGSVTRNWTAVFDSHIKLEETAAFGTSINGDLWNDSTTKKLTSYISGLSQDISTVIHQITATTTVANNDAETALVTKTLPANFFTVGKTIRLTLRGYLGTGALTPDDQITVKVKLGSTIIIATPTNRALGLGLSNREWELTAFITCRTTGATGTVFGQGKLLHFTSATTVVGTEMLATSTSTIDTTASLDLTVTSKWVTPDTQITISVTNAVIEAL